MNRRLRKKMAKKLYEGENMICDKCDCFTDFYKEEDMEVLCPRCYADMVGLSVEEIWRGIR